MFKWISVLGIATAVLQYIFSSQQTSGDMPINTALVKNHKEKHKTMLASKIFCIIKYV